MNLCVLIHLKSDYESWKSLFDDDREARSEMCDEERTTVGEVNDKQAIVTVFDVDMNKLRQHMQSPDFAERVDKHVEHMEMFSMEETSQFAQKAA